jgi:hypothetical protein
MIWALDAPFAELPLFDDAAGERELDALALFGLLREAEALLFDELRLLVLGPFELAVVRCRLLEERVLA